jgi:RNA polymerase sigma-70 factor (ECF subfamily)
VNLQLLPAIAPTDADPADGWLRAASSGDAKAFAQLVRLHQARVFSIALRLCRQREDAQEVAQDAFVQLHAVLPEITSAAHLRHWLLRTVTHRAIDRMRRNARQPRGLPVHAMDVHELAAPEVATDSLAQGKLRALLATLSADAQAVLLLRFQEDLDPMEIATVLGMPHNTVKSHLRRSLDELRAAPWGNT